ncbi:sulfotransferase family protein [Aureisphaera sp. CAU 1614]|uniref:Sulfotransferase family protein n=1 Tax=Halomarinibacterium sedimenti TaxID=2857106 RepID=A0A9X1JV92_9FLAO|nr:sulfotransferase family 2 domain-containing protein [Halomarinibacterium sedimenti]MBW2937729.1 sulfotransferase family protein [Halomarinibacterium sedimenti]
MEFDNISFAHNFIFIHVPKNAGTSIGQSLSITTTRHYTVKEYVSMLGKEAYAAMFSFAFVRNPFDRFISLYNYARMEESYYHSAIHPEKAIYGKHLDYDILKNASIEEAANFLVEGKLVHNPPHNQWQPQVTWLKDSMGKINVTYLARFEDIDLHTRNIHNILSMPFSESLPKINTSPALEKDYGKLINSNAKKIIEKYYEEDLNTFNYQF